MTRLHVPCPLTLETEIALPEDSAHHFIRVLRAQAGDGVCLFNGLGGESSGSAISVSRVRGQGTCRRVMVGNLGGEPAG